MERTHQGLSTSEMLKSYWPWSRYNEFKHQLHIWPWNLEHSRSRSQRSRWKELIKVYLHLICERVIDHGLGTVNLNANYTFDLETWNLHGQCHRQRSRWKQLMKVYLHLMCERIIDHGVGTMKLNANYTFDLETWNIQGQGNRKRSRWKELIKVYLHLKCERVIDHGLGTMKLNANNRFDLETWNLQGQGHRQRSQWVELIKVYLHVKFERGIVNGHSAMNLNTRAKPDCWRRRTAQFHRPDFASQSGQLVQMYLESFAEPFFFLFFENLVYHFSLWFVLKSTLALSYFMSIELCIVSSEFEYILKIGWVNE